MTKLIFVNWEKCVGCMCCVLGCSLQHGDMVGPTYSMILPVRLKKLGVNLPIVCGQCTKPLCADACPVGAISRDKESGAMRVDPDVCIGCRVCMIACPLGGISVSSTKGQALKCDLCEGNPLCIQFCAYGAIEFMTEEEATLKNKKEVAGKFQELLPMLTSKHGGSAV